MEVLSDGAVRGPMGAQHGGTRLGFCFSHTHVGGSLGTTRPSLFLLYTPDFFNLFFPFLFGIFFTGAEDTNTWRDRLEYEIRVSLVRPRRALAAFELHIPSLSLKRVKSSKSLYCKIENLLSII